MIALNAAGGSATRAEAFRLLPSYGREVDGFLTYIITPIYDVMAQVSNRKQWYICVDSS